MKNKLFLLFLILAVLPIALAQEPTEEQITYYSENWDENYPQYWLANPANWNDLEFISRAEDYLYTKPEFTGDDAAIAQEYLSLDLKTDRQKTIAKNFFVDASRVNGNKDAFSRFVEAEGITVTFVEGAGDIKLYSKDGTIEGTDGRKINIIDFKEDYKFEIDEEGNIKFIDKAEQKHDFTGEIKRGTDNKIELADGQIDGKIIKDGTGITIEGDEIKGQAKIIDGVILNEKKPFSYNAETNVLVTQDAEITEITEEISIHGKNIYIIDPRTKKIQSRFTGRITYHRKDYLTLGKGTNFRDFTSGTNFEVSEKTGYIKSEGGCLKFEGSCIEYINAKKRDLVIRAEDNNKIKVKLVTLIKNPLKKLTIKEIDDESIVEVDDNFKVKYTLSKGPVIADGQPIAQSVDSIEYSFLKEGEVHAQEISKGYVTECSACKTLCKVRSEVIDRSPEEIVEFVATWAIRAAQDPRYASEWGGRGEVIFRDYGNYIFSDRKMTTRGYYRHLEELKKNPDLLKEAAEEFELAPSQLLEELENYPINKKTVAIFDCIGFVQAAYDTATGRIAEEKGAFRNRKYNHGHLLHKQFREELSFKTEFHVIKNARIPPEIQKEVRKGNIELIRHENAEERAEALRNIPAGAPMDLYSTKPIVEEGKVRWEKHGFLKGQGTDTIEAHVETYDVSIDSNSLEKRYKISSLLVSYPTGT